MSDIVHFDCDVIPTQTVYPGSWRIDRHAPDGIHEYQGAWAQLPSGRWQLFITVAGTNYPFGNKVFNDGDLIYVFSPKGVEQDSGPIAVHSHTQQIAGVWYTTYTYTSHMTAETGLVP